MARISLKQFSNAPAPTCSKFCGNGAACKSKHPRNAPAPIFLRLSGRITRSMASLPAKASSAITSIPSGTTTRDSPPKYLSKTFPLIRKFPKTCPWIRRTSFGLWPWAAPPIPDSSCHKPSAVCTCFREVQFLKASSWILCGSPENITVSKLIQLRKARLSISCKERGSLTDRMPLLSKKQLLPIEIIPSGTSTCFKLVRKRTSRLPSSSIIRKTSAATAFTSGGSTAPPATASTTFGNTQVSPPAKEISSRFPQPVKTSQMQPKKSPWHISSFFSRTSFKNTCLPKRLTPGIRTSSKPSQ